MFIRREREFSTLYVLIQAAQAGEQDAAWELIQKFQPLLKKYSYKLHTEDAYEELVCFFLEVIHTLPLKKFQNPLDAVFVTYFSKSIYSHYIKLIQKSISDKKFLPFSSLEENQQYALEKDLSTDDDSSNLLLQDLQKALTEKEFAVIYGIYYIGYSSAELAKKLSTSRQNINQIKQYALRKLNQKWKQLRSDM